ncbi:MAG: urease accessory UreF family protein [Verrucomicrobiota bacterium]
MRPPQTIAAPIPVEDLLGDFHPLLEQLGSPGGLELAGAVNASLRLDHVVNLAGLKQFLQNYRAQILDPVELPLICRAYVHASKNEFSELISLDQSFAGETRVEPFASASKRIGRAQLKRLRPLRDQRGLQRYIRAVDAGHAHAWHTLVYGVTLASFSFPLRQGLLNYAEQVLNGFVIAAGQNLGLSEIDGTNLLQEICASVPRSIAAAISTQTAFALGPI